MAYVLRWSDTKIIIMNQGLYLSSVSEYEISPSDQKYWYM